MQVFIISPRGFCAGVTRALNIVEGAIEKYKGKTIYVKHEIVHNKFVVDYFVKKGVKFIEDVSEVKEKDAIIIFSAHGVSQKIEDDASVLNLETIDATCPLVKKIHISAQKFESANYRIFLIGHKNHPEVEGTMGRVNGKMELIENEEQARILQPSNDENIAYLTQTTLSLDETAGIISILKEKFPNIKSSRTSDICYATQNRQNAVKNIVNKLDLLIVIGSSNSSNSNRLKDLGIQNGVDSVLIDGLSAMDKTVLNNKKSIGITSGASCPEILVKEVVDFLEKEHNAEISYFFDAVEDVEFHTPKSVRVKDCELVD